MAGGPGHVHLGSAHMGSHWLVSRFDVAAVEPGVRQGIWQVEVSPGVFCVN